MWIDAALIDILASALNDQDDRVTDFPAALSLSLASEVNTVNLTANAPTMVHLLGAVAVAAYSKEMSSTELHSTILQGLLHLTEAYANHEQTFPDPGI